MSDTDLPKTVFAAQLRTIEPTEEDLQEAKASLGLLQALLPPGVNPEDEPDLLFIVANVAVAGLVNLNDDGIDIPTALARYKKFEKKFVDFEHDRGKVRGYIIHAGLSEFGTDRVLTEEEALASGKPFNIATVAVLWKTIDKKLCRLLQDAANPAHPDYKSQSLSFEMAFGSCYIITLPPGEREIAKATRVITSADPLYASFLPCLRANKGSGVAPDNSNERIYRIMPQDVIPLGEGIVSVPAATVKGIDVIEEIPKPEAEIALIEEVMVVEVPEEDRIDEAAIYAVALGSAKASFAALCDKLAKNCVSPTTPEVNPISTPMKPDLKKVKEQAASATKLEELQVAFASAAELADILNAESVKILADFEAQKNLAAALENEKQQALAAQAQLTTEVAAVKKELDEIKAAQALAAAEVRFQARMTDLDNEFELNDEDRALLVEDARSLDDEAFAKFMKKSKVLMKDKSKAAKAAKKPAPFEKKEGEDKDVKKEKEESCAAEIDFKETIASAVRTDATLPNDVSKSATSLLDQARAAFEGVEIGGRAISTLKPKE